MTDSRNGQIAVVFVSQRTPDDDAGYGAAAEAMAALAAQQPGYCGVDSVRDADGLGITVSYWANEASAVAWRKHAEHALIRDTGRERWYDWYALHVTAVTRSYGWARR